MFQHIFENERKREWGERDQQLCDIENGRKRESEIYSFYVVCSRHRRVRCKI